MALINLKSAETFENDRERLLSSVEKQPLILNVWENDMQTKVVKSTHAISMAVINV